MRAWLVLLLLPLAGAEPGIQNPSGDYPVTLHMHLDGMQDIALNPIAPPPTHRGDNVQGFLSHSSCLSTPGQSFTGVMHHSFYAYVSPVPVDYELEIKQPRHRGILADLHLRPQEMVLHFFIALTEAPVMPEAVLRATMRQGDDISVDHAAMDAGSLIAQAETEPATLSPALTGHPQATHHGDNVYGFRLAIPVAAVTVPAEESFHLRIDLLIENPHCRDDAYVMLDTFATHTSPELRPRLEMRIEQPVRIERLAVGLAGEALHFAATVAPVFGAADAVLGPASLEVSGPMEPAALTPTLWNRVESGVRAFPAPDTVDGRLHALRVWNHTDDQAAGEFLLRLVVPTDSGAVATAEVPFAIGDVVRTCSVLPTGEPTCSLHGQPGKKSPVPLLPVLALLGLAASLRRGDR